MHLRLWTTILLSEVEYLWLFFLLFFRYDFRLLIKTGHGFVDIFRLLQVVGLLLLLLLSYSILNSSGRLLLPIFFNEFKSKSRTLDFLLVRDFNLKQGRM